MNIFLHLIFYCFFILCLIPVFEGYTLAVACPVDVKVLFGFQLEQFLGDTWHVLADNSKDNIYRMDNCCRLDNMASGLSLDVPGV